MKAPAEWSVVLTPADAAVLDAVATERARVSPDAFGPLGHAPGAVAEAVSVGLRVLLDREALPPATSGRVTESGAWSLLLTPGLADRIGWRIDAVRPPDAAWTAAEGGAGLSTGERATVALALGFWNGTRSGVDVSALGLLDGPALSRLARCLQAIADRVPLTTWAARELDRVAR
jgi:hypothetical protein